MLALRVIFLFTKSRCQYFIYKKLKLGCGGGCFLHRPHLYHVSAARAPSLDSHPLDCSYYCNPAITQTMYHKLPESHEPALGQAIADCKTNRNWPAMHSRLPSQQESWRNNCHGDPSLSWFVACRECSGNTFATTFLAYRRMLDAQTLVHMSMLQLRW